jgi:hypothetical protein
MAFALAGCVPPGGGGSTPTPSASSPAPTPSATPTPTRTATPEPTQAPEPTPTPTPTAAPEPTTANLEIVSSVYDPSARTVSVAAMVTDRVSESGVCLLTVSQGDSSVSAQQPGMPDATVTYCANLVVTLPEGAGGTWTASVEFVDPAASGRTSTEVVVS